MTRVYEIDSPVM